MGWRKCLVEELRFPKWIHTQWYNTWFDWLIEFQESKLVGGAYFAGEILDVYGRIGGFNFYWAWVTGRIAGQHAALPDCGKIWIIKRERPFSVKPVEINNS